MFLTSTSRWLKLLMAVGLLFGGERSIWGQFKLEAPPINYWETPPNDPVAKLRERLESGAAKLEYEPHFGYLRALLKELQVPVASQSLVFSKTSLQVRQISPRSPRAIYFNDDVYLGWVQGGNIEISAVDPQLAANFYLLEQRAGSSPKLERQNYQCLQCHGSVMTRDVPGHVVRSVPAGPDGHVIASGKSFLSDHSSPLVERWGGWYVTGEHGSQRHLGNLFFRPGTEPPNLEAGANATDLKRWFEIEKYLTPHSDIVALMVLEHQANMHNRIARAGFLVRAKLFEEAEVEREQGKPNRERLQEIEFAIQQAAEPVVEYLLFAKEIPLTARIVGKSGFSEEFAKKGPRDAQGRSLRELDLQTRLFKYPCSYLIDSTAFAQLPAVLKQEIYRQIWQILTTDDHPRGKHLSVADRRAILEILRDTQRGLPEAWQTWKSPLGT